MPATESARSKNARNFYRLFNESGYTNNGSAVVHDDRVIGIWCSLCDRQRRQWRAGNEPGEIVTALRLEELNGETLG
jgi:hypothetical protein